MKLIPVLLVVVNVSLNEAQHYSPPSRLFKAHDYDGDCKKNGASVMQITTGHAFV